MKYKGLEEQSVVLVKPDGVKRGLIGEVISRFERSGLKLVALKILKVEKEFAARHYPGTDEHMKGMGEKTLETYKEYEMDPQAELGTADPLEIGRIINSWNQEFLTSGPLVAMIWQGNHAIRTVREIVGSTLPYSATPGTIRGDFSQDSPALANQEKRAIRNLIHASGDESEALNEIKLWFGPEEIVSYKRADEEVMFKKG